MPRPPDPVVFAAGPEVDEARIARWVPGTAPAGPARSSERTLLDTFDGRLHRQGMTLWREGRGPSLSLRLDGAGPSPRSGPFTPRHPDRVLAADLPDGLMGETVRRIIAERALLPRLHLRVRSRPMKVCNRDGKTVVRLAIEEPVLLRRGGPGLILDRRIVVAPVLGYGRELESVVSALGRRLQTAGSLADDALASAGLAGHGISSDIDVVLEAGMRADRATSSICRRLADVVELNLPGVLTDTDPEFLHDLRVAVRRSRSVLKEMRGVLPPDDTARARQDLRWIQEITGPTRDLDVLLLEWPAMVEPVPPAMAGDLQPLVDLLGREREEAYSAMRRDLRSRRFAVAWRVWRATIASSELEGPDSSRPIDDLAGRRIVSVYRDMIERGSAISDASPPEALHDLRKRGKELRYLLELFGSLWPPERVKPLVGALKGLQDELGHFQDDEIQVKELRSLGPALAGAPGGTDSLIALGFVVEGLTTRQMQARQDFNRRFADFADPANRRIVARTFR